MVDEECIGEEAGADVGGGVVSQVSPADSCEGEGELGGEAGGGRHQERQVEEEQGGGEEQLEVAAGGPAEAAPEHRAGALPWDRCWTRAGGA